MYNGISIYAHKKSNSILELDACLMGLGVDGMILRSEDTVVELRLACPRLKSYLYPLICSPGQLLSMCI